jgi:hypothetical protein
VNPIIVAMFWTGVTGMIVGTGIMVRAFWKYG